VLSVAGFLAVLARFLPAHRFILVGFYLPYTRGLSHSGIINLGTFVRARNQE